MSYSRVVALTVLLLSAWSRADAATATWNRNSDPVLGYILAYGTQPGVHSVSIDVGNVDRYEFFPPPGQRYYVVVKAYNAAGVGPPSTEVVLDLTVTQNQPPSLAQPANQSTIRNQPVSLTLAGSDPEGAPLTYSASGLPPGLGVTASTGVISGTPNTAGVFNVTATVSDSALSATRSFTWTITVPNQPPTLVQPADQSTPRNQSASLQLVGSDPEGAPLTYSASGLPPGLGVNASSGVISGTPTTAGTYAVTATVSDNLLSASRTFTWTITNSGTDTTPPAVAITRPTPNQTVSGRRVRLTATATDPSGVSWVRFRVNDVAIGAQDWQSPYTMYWDSTTRPNGTYQLTATARDKAGNVGTSAAITIVVSNGSSSATSALASEVDASLAGADERAPALDQPADQESVAATGVSLQINATATASEPLRFEAGGLPRGLSIDPATGLIAGTLAQDSVGVHDVRVTVSEGTRSASGIFSWVVRAAETGVRGDFDGDGRTDLAVFRDSTGEWVVWGTSVNFTPSRPVVWGVSGDVPVPADYDGDGRTDFAVYSPQSGTWRVLLSSGEYRSTLQVQWGTAADRPMAIDYDNDGRADLALPRAGGFEILLSGSNYTRSATIAR